MKEKTKHATLPFMWDDWDEDDVDTLTFYNCDMLEDFGNIKAGFYGAITVMGQMGIIQATVKDSSKYFEQKYKAVPVIE